MITMDEALAIKNQLLELLDRFGPVPAGGGVVDVARPIRLKLQLVSAGGEGGGHGGLRAVGRLILAPEGQTTGCALRYT